MVKPILKEYEKPEKLEPIFEVIKQQKDYSISNMRVSCLENGNEYSETVHRIRVKIFYGVLMKLKDGRKIHVAGQNVKSLPLLKTSPDTLIRSDYTYDTLKRLVTRFLKAWDHQLTSPTSWTYDMHYTYNGKDTLPSKVTFYYYEDQNFHSHDTIFLSYNTLGQLTRDSVVGDSSFFNRVVKYSYSGNLIFLDYTELGQPPFLETIHPGYLNSNLVYEVDTSNLGTQNNSFTYDNHPNPLYKISLTHPTSDNTYDNEFEQNNNKTEEIIAEGRPTSPLQPIKHNKYTYTYRTDGYPLTVIIKDLLHPTYIDYKAYYIYQ